MLLLDVALLKNPVAHDSHLGWALAVPTVFVYLPGGQLEWATQESVAVLLFDVNALKKPEKQNSQKGWEVSEPCVIVYFPGGHLAWAMQVSVLLLLIDVKSLKNPGGHPSHSGWALVVPAVLVYLPSGHLVWAVHHSSDHSSEVQSVASERSGIAASCKKKVVTASMLMTCTITTQHG